MHIIFTSRQWGKVTLWHYKKGDTYQFRGITPPPATVLKAKGRLKQAGKVVDSLSSIITVHSDLTTGDDTKNKTVQANCPPHAHIVPYQEGICLEFLVKPCGIGSSSFRPGKGGKSVLTEIENNALPTVFLKAKN